MAEKKNPDQCQHKKWHILTFSKGDEDGITECRACQLRLTHAEYLSWKNLKSQKLFYGVSILISVTAAAASITASYFIPNYLTRAQNKDALVQNLTEIGQERIYAAQRFYFDQESKENSQTLALAWQNYLNSLDDWNKEKIYAPMFLEYYYNKPERTDFENNIISSFAKLHDDLNNLREKGTSTTDIGNEIEDDRAKFNRFISGLLNI
jgi:hypothetical protein